MDMSSLGKWAWWIGLVGLVVIHAVIGLGVDLSSLPSLITDLLVVLAFLGGAVYLAGMKDRTGFFIVALVLGAAAAAAAGWGWFGITILAGLVSHILTGASIAAYAGAGGALFVVVYEWIMSAFSS